MAPTVMIMTLNEEIDIAGAIDSYPSGTPIVLYDSYSTDATVDIARARGAKIVQRKFDNYAAHRSWGAANIDFGEGAVIVPVLDNLQCISPTCEKWFFQGNRMDEGHGHG